MATIIGPEYDEYGIFISLSLEESDHWLARLAVAQSFEALAPVSLCNFLCLSSGFYSIPGGPGRSLPSRALVIA